MAGYSGTPLAKKLGFREGMLVLTAGAPGDFVGALGTLPDGCRVQADPGTARPDLAIAFVTAAADVTASFERFSAALPERAALWFAWPKRASGLPTDVTEDVLRDLILPTGWVDTKVCAIDATWSALRFVRRRERRAGGAKAR